MLESLAKTQIHLLPSFLCEQVDLGTVLQEVHSDRNLLRDEHEWLQEKEENDVDDYQRKQIRPLALPSVDEVVEVALRLMQRPRGYERVPRSNVVEESLTVD